VYSRAVRIPLLPALGLALLACGSRPAADPTSTSTSTSTSTGTPTPTPTGISTPTDAPDSDAAKLPSACATPSASVCTPPGDFVDRICGKPHQDIALALLSKSTPFTRLYLRGKLDELVLDEEVLVLRFHAVQKGGMVVGSGAGTYDALRWDGTCSTGIEAEMLSKSRPARPRAAGVKWHRMATRLQDALIASSEAVKRAHARRGKECKGAMSGDVSAGCAKADQALIDAIVDYVRDGGSLPEPDAP
jgi:hypothetical protein